MSEAEVSLRLAEWLLNDGYVVGIIEISIDGAQVRTGSVTHFNLTEYLAKSGWTKIETSTGWQGSYKKSARSQRIIIHSKPGRGDVVAPLRSGGVFRAECKKGPLLRTGSSPEYSLLREALGQLITIDDVQENDILVVAVPESDKYSELAERWRSAPLVKRIGIQILTVSQDGNVKGFVSPA